jgi:hypothetical protein
MYYLIDFNDKSEGLYTLKTINGTFDPDTTPLSRYEMVVSEPDLETYATLVDSRFVSDYGVFSIEAMKHTKVSFEIMKSTKHLILVGQAWEITARLKKVRMNCFGFSYAGGQWFYVSEFGLGEPVDD